MEALKIKTLNNAQVKRNLSDNGLISLGFNGQILEEEVQNCISALTFQEFETVQNGQTFQLIGVSSEGKFLMGFLFMGEKQMEMNEGQFNQAKLQIA